MRELKLRAFDDGRMVLQSDTILTNEFDQLSLFFKSISKDSIVMQFIGLLDKNGKEIYEGDIIHYNSHKGYLLKSFVAEVIWIEDQASCGYRKLGYDYPFISHHELQDDILNHLEIIGDIYQTPELLNA